MKRFLAILVVVAMVGGCAAINQFLCHPTDSQIAAANTGYAMAQSVLAGTSSLTGNPVVALLSANAIPVFQQVIAGYCVVQAEWDSAVAALQDAANQTATTKAMVKSSVIAELQAVKW
jgi:hypothetical protein